MTVPHIERLHWADIRTVLPNEARDFTPWLSRNLDLVAEVVGLDDVVLVGTESAVEDFRLDILATGTDASGDEIAVVIENQYGATDHDHLGKLITYAAKVEQDSGRVIGVWVVEHPRTPHVAAIEFLNRVTSGNVGWFLVSPRFVPAPTGFYVHFEKHVEPNEFLRKAPAPTRTAVAPERVEFMAAVYERVAQPLQRAGFRHVYAHPDGHMMRAYLPTTLPASRWAEIRVLAARNRFRVVLFVRGGQVAAEHNIAVLEGIRLRHGAALEAALPGAPAVEWNARSESDRSDYARVTWETGYLDGDPEEAAHRVVEVASACLDLLRLDGPEEFPDPGDLEETLARADAATVIDIARHVRPGEWTTYGDLSRVATGSPAAAIAVGSIARTNDDFPTPHRVLNAAGEVPAGWIGDDGGPEVPRKRLEDEGVRFLPNGRADPNSRVAVDVLRQRWEVASSGAAVIEPPSDGAA